MPSYNVHIYRTIAVDVAVEADSPEEAVATVNKSSFPLPPYDDWELIDGWRYVVYDPDSGDPVYEED